MSAITAHSAPSTAKLVFSPRHHSPGSITLSVTLHPKHGSLPLRMGATPGAIPEAAAKVSTTVEN